MYFPCALAISMPSRCRCLSCSRSNCESAANTVNMNLPVGVSVSIFSLWLMSSKKTDCGIHFFLDDYQFMRLWNNPERYIDLLKKFNCVLSPDFSLYADYPTALQIYNHYRKHWLAAYWQMYGIEVIPTICWSNEKSFEWCFDGEPKHSTVAVSSIGTQNNKTAKELFLKGYNEMMKHLQPETVIFYGKVPEECAGNIINIKSFQEKIRGSK